MQWQSTASVPFEFHVEADGRLDVCLSEHLQRSRNFAQHLIKSGHVSLHPAPTKLAPSSRVHMGHRITVHELPEPEAPVNAEPEAIPLDILFEDEHLIILNKAAGMVVHPAVGHQTGTLVHALMHHCGDELADRGGAERLGIVHRLDKDTSGLLVVAKTNVAHEKLGALFQNREIIKIYSALAKESWRQPVVSCREPIGRHPIHRKKMAVRREGRDARTDFTVERQWPGASLVACRLFTGRTHQIRVHLAHLKHPIMGDLVYGRPTKMAGVEPPSRQLLHARRLAFTHPITGGAMDVEAPLPADMLSIISQLDTLASSSGLRYQT